MISTAHRRKPGRLGGMLAVWFLALGPALALAAKSELNQVIPEVRLKDGTVLREVTFVSVGGSSITGKWAGGRGSVPLAQLPDALRADLTAVVPAKPATPGSAAGTAAASPANPAVGDAINLPTEIKLTNGFIMHQAKVVSWQADAMMVNYVGGKVLVKMDNISPEQRGVFEAHKVLVYARQARINAAKAARKSGQPAGPVEMSEEERAAVITTAIARHELVVGMTKKEVFLAIGAPERTATDETAPDYAYWFYPGKGRNEKGAPCDRIVGFNKGILDGWKDQ